MRVLAYNSSARGSGQFVRSLKVAKIITNRFVNSSFLIIAGNSYTDKPLPDRTDILRLPQISKDLEGNHVSLIKDVKRTFRVRQEVINSTFKLFSPDVLLVDSRPLGLNGELLPVLKRLKSENHGRAILMLRDIVDAPDIVKTKWAKEGIYKAIETYYDEIVILGDKNLYDLTTEYDLQPFAEKTFHLGYLELDVQLASLSDQIKDRKEAGDILVTVGGGYDGASLIHAVCELFNSSSALSFLGICYIVLGPNSPLVVDDLFNRYKNLKGRVRILSHLSDLGSLMNQVEVVISMCGYNSTMEVLNRRKKIIAIPRMVSGREQLIRSSILSNAYDGIWVLPKDKVNPRRLRRYIEKAFLAPSPRKKIPMDGHSNLIHFFKTRLGFEK